MVATQQQMIIALLCAFAIGFMTWIFLLRNFSMAWLKVKFSGGKKVLIKVVSVLGDYYVAGSYNKQHLEFIARSRKDNKEPGRTIWVDPQAEGEAFYKSFGVICIDVDDAKDCVYFRFDANYDKVPPVNTEYYDELNKTALAKPSEEGLGFFNAKTWQIIVIAGMLLCAGLAFFVYKEVKVVKTQQIMLHEEHMAIAYELNATKALIEKNSLVTTPANTGIQIGGTK